MENEHILENMRAQAQHTDRVLHDTRRWNPEPRPTLHKNSKLEVLALEAVEAGLNLDLHKDESTKEVSLIWADANALRRGVLVLASIAAACVILTLASGHWYFGSQQSVVIFTRVNMDLDEYRFREDVQALGQTISLAHFTDLTIGLHAQVNQFLDRHQQARTQFIIDLHEDSVDPFQNIEDAVLEDIDKQGQAVAVPTRIAVNAHVKSALEGLHKDVQDLTTDFSSAVDKLVFDVDEMGDSVDHLEPNLVYSVLSSLITQITKNSEGIPARERVLTTSLRPQLTTFFKNYDAFVQRYRPLQAKNLEDKLVLDLHEVWSCEFQVEMQTDLRRWNGTICEKTFRKVLSGGASAVLPGGQGAYAEALARHQVVEYIRDVFYIEHMSRLSRGVLSHLHRSHFYKYRCTTCAPEVDVLIGLLSLVQTGAVHPRWLIDPKVVADGVNLCNQVPEGTAKVQVLLAKGKILSQLGWRPLT